MPSGRMITFALLMILIPGAAAFAWTCDPDDDNLLYYFIGENVNAGGYLTSGRTIPTGVSGPTITLICEGVEQEPLTKRCTDDVGKIQVVWFGDRQVEVNCIPNTVPTQAEPPEEEPPEEEPPEEEPGDAGNGNNEGKEGESNGE